LRAPQGETAESAEHAEGLCTAGIVSRRWRDIEVLPCPRQGRDAPAPVAETARVSTLHHTDSLNPEGIVGEGVLEIEEDVSDASIKNLKPGATRFVVDSCPSPVMLNKADKGIVQVGPREAHAGAMAW